MQNARQVSVKLMSAPAVSWFQLPGPAGSFRLTLRKEQLLHHVVMETPGCEAILVADAESCHFCSFHSENTDG